jgi:hypothetical protein
MHLLLARGHSWIGTQRGMIAAALLLTLCALLIRGISIYAFPFPTGPDYGLHLLFARQTLANGSIPAFAENYQLSRATWPLLPGGPLVFGAGAALAGVDAFDVVYLILFSVPIEVIGTAALAYQLFRQPTPSLIAGAITAALPLFVDMMTWAGYPNLIALSLYPACFAAWLTWWENPSRRWLILTAVLLCGTAYLHHLSTLWLALVLGTFSIVHLLIQPRAALRRLLPIAGVCALLGAPIALEAVALTIGQDAGGVLTDVNRFEATRVTWETWARVITPMGVPLLVAGVPALLLHRAVPRSAKILIGALVLISLIFVFGWLFGLRFYYTRALYFLALPIALGGAALVGLWGQRWLRAGVAIMLIGALGVSAVARANSASAWFEIVTPDLIEAVDWLEEYSLPDEVVVSGTFFGFQMPRLLDRPLLAALTPDLISNAEILPLAADATAIMMGLDSMDEALLRHGVRYVLVRTRNPDIPNPERSRAVMNAHPRMRLIFRNADILIYEVR